DPGSCAAIGRYTYDGTTYIAAAVGTMSHHIPKEQEATQHYEVGNNLYIFDDSGPIFKEVIKTVPDGDDLHLLVTGMQMGDIDDDGIMDMVAGSYPTLDSTGLSWNDGKSQYFLLDNTETSYDTMTPDWTSSNLSKTTSIALGQFDEGIDVTDTLMFDFDADPDIFLKYFDSAPITWIDVVKEADDDTISQADWCADLKTGWISLKDAAYDDTVYVIYRKWEDIDLAEGNDGNNLIYYNGGNTQTGSDPTPVSYTVPTVAYTPGGGLTASLMDTSGAIGFVLQTPSPDELDDVMDNLGEIKKACLWYFWGNIENIQGHYFWDAMDHDISEAIQNTEVLFQLEDTKTSAQWSYPRDYDDHGRTQNRRLAQELYIAYLYRNLANRYREDGVAENGYGCFDTTGVTSYMFMNGLNTEPHFGYWSYLYDTLHVNADANVQAMSDMMKYNYGVLKNIDSNITVIGPGVGNPTDTVDIAATDTAYFAVMYDNAIGAPFKNYCDVLCTQSNVWDFSDWPDVVDLDPLSTGILAANLAVIDNICIAEGDSCKPLITKEFGYGAGISDEAAANRYVTHAAICFSLKRVKSVYYIINGMGQITPVCHLNTFNQIARLTNGCRFYTPASGSNPKKFLFTECYVYDYLFEDMNSDAYTHMIRTDEDHLEETLRFQLATHKDSISNQNVTIEMLDEFSHWERQVNEDADSAWVTFLPTELDTTVQYIIEDFGSENGDYDITINLPANRWTQISLNVDPGDVDIEDIFDVVDSDSLRIERYDLDLGFRDSSDPYVWTWPSGSYDWAMGQGYKVWTIDDTVLHVSDDHWNDVALPIDITPATIGGRHKFYIAYTPCWSMPCSTAFDSLLNWTVQDTGVLLWASNSDGDLYITDVGGPSIPSDYYNMRQGEGYTLCLTSDTTLHGFQFTYEDSSVLESWPGKPGGDEQLIASAEEMHFQFRKCTQDLYPIVLQNISIEGVEIAEGDEIGVFIYETQCVGAKKMTGESSCVITAWEDEIMTPDTVDGYIENETMSFKYWDVSAQLEYDLNIGYTAASAPQTEPKYYTTSPVFGQKSYAVLSFSASTNVEIPDNFVLHQNYPNPFNPNTTIKFDLPEAAKVKLVVFNILGQNVMTLMDATTSAGYKSVRWDASELASGLYIYRLEAESLSGGNKFASVKKMVLIK
ncbi:MAG: T9SS type A sorting domain-containing protein, partial [FCB group bacterium]|nr:T9SS type A sorting domain-containing protein [FCB group bacterium]